MTLEGEREAHPQLGEQPGPDEIGYVKCEHGHSGQAFTVGEDVDLDMPKGEFNPYCVGCIMLWVVRKARLKPMKFYIGKRPQGMAPPQGQQPQIVVPEPGLFLPNSAVEGRQRRGRQR